MSPLPGQRAVQQPLRAGTSAQRALGRAAQAGTGVLAFPAGVGWVDGQQVEVDLSKPPGQQVRRVLACGCGGECTCQAEEETAVDGGGTDIQEKEG
ncbi:hypothetical protein ACWF94_22885 [Streptomyces sp. NPDC055078]